MVVALLSLFVSLGGVSYGLATGSIDSREIKNGAVRSADVRDGAIRGKDVRDGALTGSDVDEATLGKVPSAASADTATAANTATSANSAGSALTAGSATTAVSADTAGNAGLLDGIDSTGFLRADANRVRTAGDDTRIDHYVKTANLLQVSNLAGGEYVVFAKLHVDNQGANVESPICELVAAGTVLDQAQNNLDTAASGASFLEYTLIGTFTAGALGNDDVFLRCAQLGGDNDAFFRRIVALRVS